VRMSTFHSSTIAELVGAVSVAGRKRIGGFLTAGDTAGSGAEAA
jgi:hypothetical protein